MMCLAAITIISLQRDKLRIRQVISQLGESRRLQLIERQPTYQQLGDIGMLTGMLYIDADDTSSLVKIQDNTLRNFVTVGARTLHQVDVERIGFGIV